MKLSIPILFLVILISVSSSFAQPFQSIFGKDSTSWCTLVEHFDGSHTEEFKSYNKDTMLGTVRYNQVVYSYNSREPALFLREDSIAGKLWMRNNQGNEILIMDLSLQVGDTFLVNDNGSINQVLHVANVYTDSLNRRIIQFKEKHRHTRMTDGLNTTDSCILFIEGIGPTTGIAQNVISVVSNELLCVYKDEIKTFANNYYKGVCYIQYGAAPSFWGDLTPTVYPTPCNDIIHLQHTDDKLNEAAFYTLQGQLALKLTIDNSSKSINTTSLTPGVYYLTLSTKSAQKYKPIKIIKL